MDSLKPIKGKISSRNAIERTTLLRDVYRILLQTGRTYAAFEPPRIIPLIETIQTKEPIFDPMSGYGTLMDTCSKMPFRVGTFNVECNPPSFLWQVLVNPANSYFLINLCEELLSCEKKWPKSSERASICSDWFPSQSLLLVENLFKLITLKAKTIKQKTTVECNCQELVLALLLPFVGRFSSCVQGNVVTHVKIGGMVIYDNWEIDFKTYLNILKNRLDDFGGRANSGEHKTIIGDARNLKIPKVKFKSMITSPPYPNSRSYSAMFHPENAILNYLETKGLTKGYTLNQRLIGSPLVSESVGISKKDIFDVKSKTAKKFLNEVVLYKGGKQAEYDNKVYYLPYFAQYFEGLEQAYTNIAANLAKSFEGYIIVVNNTHRKRVIPVAQSIIEMWLAMGFNAEFVEEYTRELSHLGGLNPRVKGLTARHTEYTIRITR